MTVHRGDRHWAARGSHDVPPLNFRYDSHPPGKVRRAIDRPGWVPFVLGTGGDYLAVDMDPGPNGRPGQVIRIGGDSDDGPVYVTDSVTTLLRKHVEALANGDYTMIHDSELYIEVEPDWRDLEGARRSINSATASAEVLRPEVEHLTVTAADEVDLALVRGAPILRWVQLSGGASAEPGPLRDTPVEILELDLSNATVADIATIADLEGLRYLSLRHRQWLELWEHTDRLPPLAKAFLAGKASQETAVEWVTRLHAAAGQIRG